MGSIKIGVWEQMRIRTQDISFLGGTGTFTSLALRNRKRQTVLMSMYSL